jgi:hypothetical protein
LHSLNRPANDVLLWQALPRSQHQRLAQELAGALAFAQAAFDLAQQVEGGPQAARLVTLAQQALCLAGKDPSL